MINWKIFEENFSSREALVNFAYKKTSARKCIDMLKGKNLYKCVEQVYKLEKIGMKKARKLAQRFICRTMY